MNETNKYSDEHISAFIDGELDKDERTLLLFAEQEDADLAQRINEARMLKEKVQLSFADLPRKNNTKAFSCRALVNKPLSLVASLIVITAAALLLPAIIDNNNDELILAKQLIENTDPIAPEAINSAIGTNKHIIINISQYQPESFDNTIAHIETLLQKHKSDSSFSIEVVANKTGLKALDAETSVHAERLSQMASQFSNLEVVACAKSLAKFAEEGDPIQLMKSFMITSSAAERISKRTGDGWLYLKL